MNYIQYIAIVDEVCVRLDSALTGYGPSAIASELKFIMAEGGRDVVKIDPLIGSNYRSWKYNIKLVLMERGLWGFAQGNETAPVAEENDKKEKEIKEYKLKLDKAYSTIALSVCKRLQVHINETDDPKKAWDTLEKLFNFVSVPEIVRVNRSFYAATMSEGSDLNEHLTKMTELASRLRELKEDISPKKFATTVLGSLPESYDVFISSLNARSADQLDWDEIKPLLIEEYTRRKEKVQQRNEEAMFSQRMPPGNQQHHVNQFRSHTNQGGRRGTTNRRQNQNHNHNFQQSSQNFQQRGVPNFNNQMNSQMNNQTNFPSNMNSNFQFSQQRSMNTTRGGTTITCFRCNEPGHKAFVCPHNSEEASFVSSVGRRMDSDETARIESPNKRRKLNDGNNFGVVDNQYSLIQDDVALTSSSKEGQRNEEWFLDSAASSNMTHNENNLEEYKDYKEPSNVFLGDDRYIPAIGEGKLKMKTADENTGKSSELVLNRVLHVPQLAKNLISVSSIAVENNAEVVFDREKCTVYTEDQKLVIGRLSSNGKLYKVVDPPVPAPGRSLLKNPESLGHQYANYSSCESPLELWHYRLGHLNHKYMRNMYLRKLVDGMKVNIKGNNDMSCESCVLGKMHKSSCPNESQNRASQLLEIIHTDVCGPMQIDSMGGSRYFVTFTDDFSRYTTVYFMRKKSEVLTKFKEYVNQVENKTGSKIKKLNIWNTVKSLRSDNGGEYSSAAFQSFCVEKGISRQFTNPYTPEQNGVSERLNRTIIEAVRSMLIHSNLPLSFWAEAVRCAVYTNNRSPTSALQDATPFECWFGVNDNVTSDLILSQLT